MYILYSKHCTFQTTLYPLESPVRRYFKEYAFKTSRRWTKINAAFTYLTMKLGSAQP